MTPEHPQEYVILGLLMMQQRHGYEIHRYFTSGLGRAWHAGMSHIYALLKRLEAADNVLCCVEPQDNRPAKKVYSITPKGRNTFISWVSGPVDRVRDLRLEFMAKLFFMKELKLPGLPDLFNKQVEVCNRKLLILKNNDRACSDMFDHLVFQFRIHQIEAMLRWLDDCRHYLTSTSGATN